MRAIAIQSLCCAGGLVLFGTGCGSEPPPPRICPKIVVRLPDVPEEKRVTFGTPCRQDSDCRSGLCDRGRCGDPYWWGNYGRECVPGPSPAEEDLEREQARMAATLRPSLREAFHLTPFGQNLCSGYLCIEFIEVAA